MTLDLTREPAAEGPEIDPAAAPPPASERRWFGALAGLVAGAVAVTGGMLVAAVIEVVSPIDAVGSAFIDRTPPWLKELAIQWFDTNDKMALRAGIVMLLAVAALVIGAFAVRRPWVGTVGIVAFGLVGAWAGLTRPGEQGAAWLPALLGAVAGIFVLDRLLQPLRSGATGPRETPGPSRAPLGWDRRRFLATSGAAAVVAVAAGATASALERRRVEEIEASIPDALPAPANAAPPIGPGATVEPLGPSTAPAVTPYVTPNVDFYRIDTALSFPRVAVDRWRLDITGMVGAPLSITYADLLDRPQVERVVTLCCVSNEVGGRYIGNAVWQGVLLADLLDEAGVDPAAEQLFSTSIDGWTCGFPLAAALDGRDAMVAVGMNGEALPLAHGFPARLVVPGLYGYVSATKWLRTIDVTTWDAAEGYWVPRGWSRDAPIKTQSRIDVPRRGEAVPAGATAIAGVAWAQHRGIARVEVRVDEGPWRETRLGDDVTDDAWRQWVIDWDATPGRHTIQVRATDKTGATQTAEVRPPAPDGATGYHTRTVEVS